MRLYRSPWAVLVVVGLLGVAPVAAQDAPAAKAGAPPGDPWGSRDAAAQQASPAKPSAPKPPSAAAASAASSDTWASRDAAGSSASRDKAAPRKQAAKKARSKDKKARPAGAPTAGSPGFAMLQAGKSRIFVEVSRKVQVTEHKAQGRIVYRIKGASVPLRNNRLPLLTGFFPTPVLEARLVEQDDDVALIIDLRQASDVEHRIVDSEGGIVVQVDFPAVKSFVPPAVPNAPSELARRKRMTEARQLESTAEPHD